MYVSKNVILGLLLAGAGLLGWSSQSILAHLGDPAPAVALSPSAGQDAAGGPVAQSSQAAPDAGTGGPAPVTAAGAPAGDSNMYMTIVNTAGGNQPAAPVQAISSDATTAAYAPGGAAPRSAAPGGRATQAVYAPTVGPAGPRGATGPSGPGDNNQNGVTIRGNNITIASNGAVVMIGDDGSLNANTGDTAASGTVAIDAPGSTVRSGSSTVTSSTGAARAPASSDVAGASFAAGTSLAAATSTVAGSGWTGGGVSTGIPSHSNGSLDSTLVGLGGPGTSVSIAGFEDHSVSVIGDDHLVTYDDSNVFINRIGQVNANTGDTDSSGLNVVDAVDSVVRSGNSGDGEGSGDDEEEEDAEEEDPGTVVPGGEESPSSDDEDGSTSDETAGVVASDVAGDVSAVRTMTSRTASSTGGSAGLSTTSSSAPWWFPASAGVDDEDVATTANGSSAYVIGADGYDDVSIRVNGNRDLVTYDDSNVVVGGIGGVNAQIGDSDTGGAVVMGVRNSYIQAGCEGDLCYSGQTP